jgi:hypothetical protein
MTTNATASPIDLRLTADEIADRDVRHRNMRSRYRDLGFDSVSEAQAYSDSLAVHAAGEPVSPAFVAAQAAAEKRRATAAAQAASDAAAWAEQQKHVAAVERRDRADERLRTCRGNAAAYRLQAVMNEPPDFGRPIEFAHGLGWAGTDLQSAHLINHLEKTAIPALAGELAQAQADLAAMSKPTTTAKATGRS